MRLPASRLVILLLALGLVLRLAVAALPHRFLVTTGLFGDDAFYCLNIARHIALGHGATHDGIHPTNGFQPLWVFMLVPIFELFPHNLVAPIHAAAVVLGLVSVATGYLLYRLTALLAGSAAGVAALVLWLFSAYVIRQTMNGMETGISAFFVVLCAWTYLSSVRPPCSPTSGRVAAVGLWLSLAVLARLDNLILVAWTTADYLVLSYRSKRDWRLAIGSTTLLLTPALLLAMLWLASNQREFGSPLPVSGQAVRFLSLTYAGLPPTAGLATVMPHSLPLAMESLLNLKQWRFLLGWWWVLWLVVALGLAVVATVYVYGGARLRDVVGGLLVSLRKAAPIGYLLGYFASLVVAYVTFVLGWWFYPRYFFPKAIVGAILLALVYEAVVVGPLKPWGRTVMNVLLASAVAAQLLLGAAYFVRSRAGFGMYYEAAQWINRSVPRTEKVGAFQSGIMGYFSTPAVVGLDGVVNHGAYKALREGRILEYMKAERLRCLVDDPSVLDSLLSTDRSYAAGGMKAKVKRKNGFSIFELD